MITFFNVNKAYPNQRVALHNVSLQIRTGEMVFLQGHSGAGKSTLLKLIALLERPSSGHIVVGGKNIIQIPPSRIPFYRRRLGFITQHPRLLNHETVFENVALPLIIVGFHSKEIRRRVRAALERVGLLEKENYKPSVLSEGERQRVGIARAVVHKPHFLLADEPTGNLDPALSLEIMQLFERFHQVGVTVIIASHDIKLMEKFPYRKLQLVQGKLLNTPRNCAEEITSEFEKEPIHA